MRISDWSSDVCSSDLVRRAQRIGVGLRLADARQAVHRGNGQQAEARDERHEHRQAHRIAKLRAAAEQPRRGREQPVEQRENERSEEHTSELQSLMRISYAVFRLKKKNSNRETRTH